MDATVIAAVVGVGGAVLTAITSVVATIWAARRAATAALASAEKTAQATLESAGKATDAGLEATRLTLAFEHDRRVWEKRAELYVDTIAFVIHRRETRRKRGLDAHLANYQLPPWFQFEGRLQAFASKDVLKLWQDAHDADNTAWSDGIIKHMDLAEDKADTQNPDKNAAAAYRASTLIKKADRLDEQLIDLIRIQLQERSSQTP
ncbi:hypothetical protein [Nonomuraea sp. NPDC049784]|uniref:hypothetical protein n=1 Tax=Nonomuraea sp. NPDC049784 TaxID=3154361 RepID=UPI0033FD6AD4